MEEGALFYLKVFIKKEQNKHKDLLLVEVLTGTIYMKGWCRYD